MPPALALRALSAATLLSLSAATAHAQAAPKPDSPKHPAVCAKGVRVYTAASQVPTPHDTLTMPTAPGPVMVTSPEEAEAAELAMRGRAGSVGATGVIVSDIADDNGAGEVRMHRTVTAVYVPAESARAQQACKDS